MKSFTIDMFCPTVMYPDIWCTPGVVSQTPESETNLNPISAMA